jgi:SAM-dependent methyltransferase
MVCDATEMGNEQMGHCDEVGRIRRVYAEWEGTLDKANAGYQRSLLERNETLKRMLSERFGHTLSQCRILDIGCGYGSLLGWFYERGVPAQGLFGVDLLPSRIKSAREAYPAFTFIEGNAEHLDFPNGWFSLVAVFTVFSSILDGGMARSVARRISRVLASSGAIIWYDMRYPNPRNLNVRAMTKPRIQELFPLFEMDLESVSLLPPVARHLGRLTERGYPLLTSIPILRSHYLGLLWPRHPIKDRHALGEIGG